MATKNIYVTFWFNKEKNYIPSAEIDKAIQRVKKLNEKTSVDCFFIAHNYIQIPCGYFSEDINLKIIDFMDICSNDFKPIFAPGNDITIMIDFGKHIIIQSMLAQFADTPHRFIVSDNDAFNNSVDKDVINIEDWFIDEKLWKYINIRHIIDNHGENQIYVFDQDKELQNKHNKFYIQKIGALLLSNLQYLTLNHKAYTLSSYYIILWNKDLSVYDKLIFDTVFQKDIKKFNKTYTELKKIVSDNYMDLTTLSGIGEKTYTAGIRFPFELTSYSEDGLSDEGVAISELLFYLSNEKK